MPLDSSGDSPSLLLTAANQPPIQNYTLSTKPVEDQPGPI